MAAAAACKITVDKIDTFAYADSVKYFIEKCSERREYIFGISQRRSATG